MLIYAYADILGYRELLKNRKATEVYSLLNEAVTEVHRMLNQYMKSELVLKQYKNSLYGESNY